MPDTARRKATVGAAALCDMLIGGARNVGRNREALNRMNVFPVPDGDTGTNLALTLDRMELAVADARFETTGALAQAAARGALLGARGNSGVIMSQILRGFADGLDSCAEVAPMELAHAFVSASDRAYQAVIKPVEGTILTVIKDAAGAAVMRSMDEGVTVPQVLNAALAQARETLARTPQMLEKLRQAGVVDAGGQGLVFFFEGMLTTLLGEAPIVKRAQAAGSLETAAAPGLALDFKYCTEVSFNAPPGALDAVRGALQNDSDSLLVVGAGEMVKVHVHTNRPDIVLGEALRHGELLAVKIDNMAVQHNELMRGERAAAAHEQAAASPEPTGRTAVLTVVNGDGLARIFRSFGAAGIIQGGQSMNPSAEDILNVIAARPEPEIIILPNNGNIIMAAERAAEMCGRPARVAPTHTIPEGIAAMLDFDPQASADDLATRMAGQIADVTTAEITRAVRDATTGGLEIKQDDFIAVIDGDIRATNGGIFELLCSVLDIFKEKEVELVTFYRGSDLPDADARLLVQRLSERFPDLDFELHDGGQPLYPLIISGE